MPPSLTRIAVHIAPALAASSADARERSAQTLQDAYIAFRLTSVGPQTTQQRLDAQVRLYAALPRPADLSLGARVAYALRYIILPPEASGTPSRISCVLLARLSNWMSDERRLRAEAHDLAEMLSAVLAACLASYRFAPIGDAAEIANALSPFPIHDLCELRPRMLPVSQVLSLPVPMSGIPSVAKLIDVIVSRAHAAHLISVGFAPSAYTLPTPAFAAEPSEPDLSTAIGANLPERAGEPRLVYRDEGVHQPVTYRLHEQVAVQRWMRGRGAVLDKPFHIQIQIASAERIAPALPQIAGIEFGGPCAVTPSPYWETPGRAPYAGTEVVIPRTTSRSRSAQADGTPPSEFAAATRNLCALRHDPWGDTPSLAVANLPELADGTTVQDLAALVSFNELARLAPLPDAAAWLPNRGSALPLPFLGGRTSGVRIGTNDARGEPSPVHWPAAGRSHHAMLLGATGAGKSTLAHTLIMDDIRNGRGTIVIDPHDQLIESLLERIPPRRMRDVILLDAADTARPLGINLMDQKTPEQRSQVVTRFLAQLQHSLDPHSLGIVGPIALMTLRHGMQAIMDLPHGGTLLEVFRLYSEEDFLRAVLPYVKDSTARMFFHQFLAMSSTSQAEYVLHGISKVSEWVSDPIMRHIVAQRTTSFDFAEAMNTGKIVLCQLRSGILGSDMAAFLGHTLLPMIYQAALSRLALRPQERRPCSLYVDEAATFAGDQSVPRMLAECRKAMMSVNLIYQFLSQMDPTLRDAVLANVGSVFAFRPGVQDVAILEHVFAPSPLSVQHLSQLPRGMAYSSIMLDNGQRTPVFLLETELPSGRSYPARATKIRALSSQRYGRAREDVDAAIASRADARRWVLHGDAGATDDSPASGAAEPEEILIDLSGFDS